MIENEKIDSVKIFRLSRSILGRALYFTTCYWVDGLMVDTGCFYTERELVSALNGLKVDCIVNTHSHEDHVGANAAIKKMHGADIFAHANALPQLENPLHNGPLRPYQKIMWGKPAPSAGSEIGKTLQTDHHNFEVIYTPGHSIDHISLYEPNMGWLFTGDTYIGGLDTALRHDYNVWQIISSLKKLIKLNACLLFPGSGNVRRDPQAALLKKVQYLEEVGDKVMSLHAKGYSLRKIRKTLFGNETLVAYFTLGHFSGKNLVRSYIANQAD